MGTKILLTLNEENVSTEELSKYSIRRAVRVVLLNSERKIAVLYSAQGGYYTLPGGSVEESETFEDGALRETKEETGCDIRIIKMLGEIQEVRAEKNVLVKSVGYIAEINGEIGEVSLQEDEVQEDLQLKWVSFEEASILISLPIQEKLYHRYVQKRDAEFIIEGQRLLTE